MFPGELRGYPGRGGMTCRTIRSKLPTVWLVVVMAGVAILWRYREIPKAARVDMALHTGKPHMLSGELEGKGIVIEFVAESVHAIMTIKTGRTKGEAVRSHECKVHLTMARVTSLKLEGCDVALMAIVTWEELTRNCLLMGC